MFLEKLKYTDWSSKNILLAVTTIIGMIGLYGWLVKPHTQYLKAAENYNQTIKTLKKEQLIHNGKLKAEQRKLDELATKLNENKNDYFEVTQALTFLESVQSKIKDSGCLVETLKFLPTNKIDTKNDEANLDIRQYKIDLSIVGQYPNIVNFIAKIQNQNKKVWIEEMNLHTTPQGLLCDMTVMIYTMQVKERADNVETKE